MRIECCSSENAPIIIKATLAVIGVALLVLAAYGLICRSQSWLTLTASWIILGTGGALVTAIGLTFLYKKTLNPQSVQEEVIDFNRQDTSLCHYSFIESNPHYLAIKNSIFNGQRPLKPIERRAIAIMLSMAIGDSVGAPFEFLSFKKEGYKPEERHDRFNLEPGQWTDDASMGLCLADSLVKNNGLDGTQLMWSFIDWWLKGYNSAFSKTPRTSVGLGGNIREGMLAFLKLGLKRDAKGHYATQAGDKFTSGNGSLMRNAPIALFAKSYKEAIALSWQQSKVTHQGDEAAACCQLMTSCIYTLLHSEETDTKKRKSLFFEHLADYSNRDFDTVMGLAHSSELKNENWNWKDPNFSFNAERLNANSGYIGSYAMDALAMALHCVYTTDTFEEAVLKASMRGGDADSVGTITAQLAASIYGLDALPKTWMHNVQQWDRAGDIATRAYLLVNRK